MDRIKTHTTKHPGMQADERLHIFLTCMFHHLKMLSMNAIKSMQTASHLMVSLMTFLLCAACILESMCQRLEICLCCVFRVNIKCFWSKKHILSTGEALLHSLSCSSVTACKEITIKNMDSVDLQKCQCLVFITSRLKN